MATVFFYLQNFSEAIKHYGHAYDVLSHHEDKKIDRGRILYSCATIFRLIGDNQRAKEHYLKSIEEFKYCDDYAEFEHEVFGEFKSKA